MICTDWVGEGRQDEHMMDVGEVNHKTRQDNTRQDKTTQHKTTQDKGRERKLFDVSDRPTSLTDPHSRLKKHKRSVFG